MANDRLCNIDQPLFHRSVKPSAHTTSNIGYVRLHGRNYRNWFSIKANVRERYDYLYSPDELDPWITRTKQIADDARDTYVVTNNHNLGKAAVNALEIAAIIKGEAVSVPPPLLLHYPQLREFATDDEQK